jgi:hypothetical protein
MIFESVAFNHGSAGFMPTLVIYNHQDNDMIYYSCIASAADLLQKSVELREAAADEAGLRSAKRSG